MKKQWKVDGMYNSLYVKIQIQKLRRMEENSEHSSAKWLV